MKYKFEEPKRITIRFTPYPGGDYRRPKIIKKCTQIHIGKIIVVVYIARDNREHRHKYYFKNIMKINSGKEVYYSVLS